MKVKGTINLFSQVEYRRIPGKCFVIFFQTDMQISEQYRTMKKWKMAPEKRLKLLLWDFSTYFFTAPAGFFFIFLGYLPTENKQMKKIYQ